MGLTAPQIGIVSPRELLNAHQKYLYSRSCVKLNDIEVTRTIVQALTIFYTKGEHTVVPDDAISSIAYWRPKYNVQNVVKHGLYMELWPQPPENTIKGMVVCGGIIHYFVLAQYWGDCTTEPWGYVEELEEQFKKHVLSGKVKPTVYWAVKSSVPRTIVR